MQRNRTRKLVSAGAIGCSTALMWSDTAITWWSNFLNFAMRVNSTATQSVLDNRPSGDADLHAVVWGFCALLIAYALNWRDVWRATAGLFVWTVFVELAQPWFTEMRSRQLSDLIGNCFGILLIAISVEVIAKVRARR